MIPDALARGDLLPAPRESLVGPKGCRSATGSAVTEPTKIVGARCRSSTEVALRPVQVLALIGDATRMTKRWRQILRYHSRCRTRTSQGEPRYYSMGHYDPQAQAQVSRRWVPSDHPSGSASPFNLGSGPNPNSESAEKEAKRLEREARLTSKVARVEYDVDAKGEEKGLLFIYKMVPKRPSSNLRRVLVYHNAHSGLKYKSAEVFQRRRLATTGMLRFTYAARSTLTRRSPSVRRGSKLRRCTQSDYIEAVPAGVRFVDEDRENIRGGNRSAGILKGDVCEVEILEGLSKFSLRTELSGS
ncbi:hypothetical protein EDB85DRAFT_2276665 [Lactarius pseudohatsudake]|nr:hypothetical protein EDB85DRAFT_2276665 [Lactarius pseudohatsudake]